GDLRLEHVHLSPRHLSIYDCIEFNDRLRYIDWANDIAFLAMDFDYQGYRDFSASFTHRMATALRDDGLLQLIDFYKCYRAYVRGKVESFQAAGAPEKQKKKHVSNAKHYFQLALHYAVCGSQPTVLVVMGRIASGKSTLAKSLGGELGWEVLSSDRLRKNLAGVPAHTRGTVTERQHLYSASMTRKTYQTLLRKAAELVRKHSSVILDATFSQRRQRDRLRSAFERAGIRYRFVEAYAPDNVIRQRLKSREKKATEISDARLEDFRVLSGSYQAASELPRGEFLRVSTATTPELAAKQALKGLAAIYARGRRVLTVRARGRNLSRYR
ncbi:MAG TPA: AAA family ATPase, partial [Terrimicrobiaceae bacterium]